MISENITPVIRRGNDVCGTRPQFSRPTHDEDRNWPLVSHRDPERGFIRTVDQDGRCEEFISAKVFHGPLNQHYASSSSRMETFKKWPQDAVISPEKLVEAGFYYLGQSDMVRCFYCDLGLQQWDPEDDAWVEHAKHQPECFYVNLIKGEDFIQKCTSHSRPAVRIPEQRSEVNPPSTSQTPEPELEQREQVTEQPSPPEPSVEQTPPSSIENSVADVNTEVFSEDQIVVSSEDEAIISPEQASSSENPESSESCPASDLSTPPESPTESPPPLASSKSSVNSSQSNTPSCLICLEKDVRVFFYPCGHAVTCIDCSMAVTHCIACRKRITALLKIHYL